MDPKTFKGCKKTYFTPKKEPLVKKMIFDPHEAHVPSSCFDLRPIHESQSNQQDIIFDPKSSSMKEISEFEKNSPHEFDKMIYGHNSNSIQNEAIYIESDQGTNSPDFTPKSHEESQSLFENENQRKRGNPVSYEETQKYEKISKMIHVSEKKNQLKSHGQNKFTFDKLVQKVQFLQSPLTKNKNANQQRISLERSQKKIKRPQINFALLENQNKIFMQEQQPKTFHPKESFSASKRSQNPSILEDHVKIQQQSHNIKPIDIYIDFSAKKSVRKSVKNNPEFQLINEYMELASYAALIDEMILVYDRSPLFEFPLDFDSETDQDSEEPKNHKSSNQASKNLSNQKNPDCEVKIEHVEEQMIEKLAQQNKKIVKDQKEFYNQFERLKLSEATDQKEKQRIIKEIHFNRSKINNNFYEAIKELRPHIKKMTLEEKRLFLAFKKQLKEIKDIVDYFERKNQGDKKEHICKICGEEFESGRQLGGHMSRKHPGKAFEYGYKKDLHRVKQIERNRRKFFRQQEYEAKIQQQRI